MSLTGSEPKSIKDAALYAGVMVLAALHSIAVIVWAMCS